MGLFDALVRPGRFSPTVPVMPGLEGPNASSSLAKVVYSEYFTGEVGEVTRESALQIPAIKKARDVLAGIVMTTPLVEVENGVTLEQPWLTSTTSQVSPQLRNVYIFDDLFFYDWSAVAVQRDSFGQITDAAHIPFGRWTVENDGTVKVDHAPANNREIVLIPGNGSGGILSAGAPTIRGARALERAWIGRAQNPIPLLVLQQQTDDELEDDEIDEMLEDYALARTSPTGAVAFADHRVRPEAIGTVNTDLFEQGRNAIVLDVARITGVPASILDGSQSTATLTYSTTEGKRNEFDDYTLPMWFGPVEARFSMDDVSGPGRVIRFDMSARRTVTPPTINQPVKD